MWVMVIASFTAYLKMSLALQMLIKQSTLQQKPQNTKTLLLIAQNKRWWGTNKVQHTGAPWLFAFWILRRCPAPVFSNQLSNNVCTHVGLLSSPQILLKIAMRKETAPNWKRHIYDGWKMKATANGHSKKKMTDWLNEWMTELIWTKTITLNNNL